MAPPSCSSPPRPLCTPPSPILYVSLVVATATPVLTPTSNLAVPPPDPAGTASSNRPGGLPHHDSPRRRRQRRPHSSSGCATAVRLLATFALSPPLTHIAKSHPKWCTATYLPPLHTPSRSRGAKGEGGGATTGDKEKRQYSLSPMLSTLYGDRTTRK